MLNNAKILHLKVGGRLSTSYFHMPSHLSDEPRSLGISFVNYIMETHPRTTNTLLFCILT